jgi:hypothetical protein
MPSPCSVAPFPALTSSLPCPTAFLFGPPASAPCLRYGSETVGAEDDDDDDLGGSAESFDAEGVSFPSPAGGAESFAGKDLVLFAVFKDVPSPSVGVGFEESFAAWVFGLESVPRTDLECDVSTMVVYFIEIEVCGSRIGIAICRLYGSRFKLVCRL